MIPAAAPVASSRRPGGSVVIFPRWRANPYITIMYLAARSGGLDIVGARELTELDEALAEVGDGDVLHVHWTSPVCQAADDADDAASRLKHFVEQVDRFRADGGKLVWTVHNALPHELHYPELERELYRYLAGTADAIHVMNPATAEVVAETCALDPAKTHVIPHPSYQGIYAARQSERAAARDRLGIPQDRRTVMFFGMMRAYKGVETLLDALQQLVDDGRPTPLLLLAGRTDDDMLEIIEDRLPPEVEVVREHDHVPDDQVESWYGSADLAVFPYKAILNSGSVHLAATFGVPCVLPDEPHLQADLGSEPWVRWIDPERTVQSLADVLADPASYEREVTAMRAFSERVSPWRVSRQMAALLESVRSAPQQG